MCVANNAADQEFDRRSTAKQYRSFVAKLGVVNPFGSTMPKVPAASSTFQFMSPLVAAECNSRVLLAYRWNASKILAVTLQVLPTGTFHDRDPSGRSTTTRQEISPMLA
jgi:hypothetical protein